MTRNKKGLKAHINPTITLSIKDLIIAESINSKHNFWKNCPFNIKFSPKKLTLVDLKFLKRPAIYIISQNNKTLYLGKYQPKSGNIVKDRLVKHISTITARGHRLSFGAENRYERIRVIIKNKSLKKNISKASEQKYRKIYFRDSGHTTTINRLRYADENWNLLEKATDVDLLNLFSVHLFLIKINQPKLTSNKIISDIEKNILNQIHPICNKEYKPDKNYKTDNYEINNAIKIITHSIMIQSKIHSWEYAKYTKM